MDATHCKYRSKTCYNARALKKGGSLHRFCSFHRDRANDSQRRWQERRRQNGHTSRPYDSESYDESDAISRKRRCTEASQNYAVTTPTRIDAWIPITSNMTWAVDASFVTFLPSAPRPDTPFFDADLVLLEALMSEPDGLSVDDARIVPEAAFTQAFGEEAFALHL